MHTLDESGVETAKQRSSGMKSYRPRKMERNNGEVRVVFGQTFETNNGSSGISHEEAGKPKNLLPPGGY